MNTFDFYLYRLKLTFDKPTTFFAKDDLSRPELILNMINSKPSSKFQRGQWHIGNIKQSSKFSGYFAVGKTTKAIKEKFDEDSGNFIIEEDENSPYTHVIFDSEIGLLAIAKKNKLAQTINGIANKTKQLFQRSDVAFNYGITVALDPISDPRDFIDALQSAYNIRSFTATFSRSNPFDSEEFFHKPMERVLDATNGKEGKTTLKGDDLESDALVEITKSVAATGNDAVAYLKPTEKEGLIRKSLIGNPAHFSILEQELNAEQVLVQARKVYSSVRTSQQ